ncbi:uncharacterized protein [Maniola hyperantus]|uniref:uncharacterized protein n=1 Tax=Aphantopus hyperantus TaxID=2795564 RepID=UPI002123728B
MDADMLDRLNKLREKRIAREKARLDKLRELNKKKYDKYDFHPPKPTVSTISRTRAALAPSTSKSDIKTSCVSRINRWNAPKSPLTTQTLLPNKVKEKKDNINSKESVFDRLYKPKVVHKQAVVQKQTVTTKPKTGPTCTKKASKDVTQRKVRRSISAIDLEGVNKNELPDCIHNKWASIGDHLHKKSIQDSNDDEGDRGDEDYKGEKVTSPVTKESKKVTFQIPPQLSPPNSPPNPEKDIQGLQSWLNKRGKSLDSYYHLQWFGLNSLSNRNIKPHEEAWKFDDAHENKENVASGSGINNRNGKLENEGSPRFPAHRTSPMISRVSEALNHELLLGALNELKELLREDFNCEQSACWLRALYTRFSTACESSATYWECRAELAHRQGDFPVALQCLEQAIAKSKEIPATQTRSEEDLDGLVDKFKQRRINPN